MKSFFKSFFIALLCTLGVSCFAKTGPDSVRKTSSFDDGWKFIREDVTGAEVPGFDDSAWKPVQVPHTWNNLDGEQTGNKYYRGPGWYRRHLELDSASIEKSLFLKFEGAATVTDLFVNGKPVGTHKGAFGAFCFEITPFVNKGDNVIAVRVNNAKNPAVAPLSGDFTVFGGLYRDVHLLKLNKLSISPLDYASPGVYLKQSDVSEKNAGLEIETVLRNSTGNAKTATLKYTLLDAKGKTILSASTSQTIASGSATATSGKLSIANPHLWNGRKDPYLYQVKVDLMDGETVADSVTQPLGLRYFKVDKDQGFFLNGAHYPLHGVNRHQDRKDKGWAIGEKEHQQDFDLIMEMGCTGIRLAHYQHADFFYGLCDKGGLVAWAELPLVNDLGCTAEFDDNAKQQLNELIKQNYNHPAILFWSLFNELHPEGKWLDAPADWTLIPKLNDLAHQLDPGRLTASAACIKPNDPLNRVTDLIGFNRYPGWYYEKPESWPKTLDGMRNDLPTCSIGITEYGAGANTTHHEADPKQPDPGGKWHPEEWQSHIHETAWNSLQQHPWLWCTFVWNMFDFASAARKEGELPGLNDKGLVTYDRKIKKDSFYWYKANWSQSPVVHITESRFTPRPAGAASIRVYSNFEKVELRLNGKSLGEKSGADHIFQWDNAPLSAGENRVEAVAKADGKKTIDSCVWIGSADKSTPDKHSDH